MAQFPPGFLLSERLRGDHKAQNRKHSHRELRSNTGRLEKLYCQALTPPKHPGDSERPRGVPDQMGLILKRLINLLCIEKSLGNGNALGSQPRRRALEENRATSSWPACVVQPNACLFLSLPGPGKKLMVWLRPVCIQNLWRHGNCFLTPNCPLTVLDSTCTFPCLPPVTQGQGDLRPFRKSASHSADQMS